MPEGETFRFLSDAEFMALPIRDRAEYLMRAAHELEARQQLIRNQLKKLADATRRSE